MKANLKTLIATLLVVTMIAPVGAGVVVYEKDEKKVEIARLVSAGYSWSAQKLRQEIRKCRVLCANCHRKHSISQAGHYSEKSVRDALQRILAEHDIDE